MIKRIVSLILALVLLVPVFAQVSPVIVSADTNTEDIRAKITKELRELQAKMNPGDSAYDGTLQLLSHAMTGGGKDLIMDESDYFTGLVFYSNMFQDAFVDGLTASFERLLHNYEQKMLVRGNYDYYEHKMSHSSTAVKKFTSVEVGESVNQEEIRENSIETLVNVTEWTGTVNSFDEAMIMVAGGLNVRFTITKTSANDKTANYNVAFSVRDNFDFTKTDYQSSDAQLAKALTWLGKLMQHGAIVTPYHWEINLEFDITLDNDCTHQTQTYRWEHNGADMVEISGDGLMANSIKRIDEVSSENGEALAPYYELSKTIKLYHDLPWVVEFQAKNANLFLGPGKTYATGTPYLLKTWQTYVGGESFQYQGISDTTGEKTTLTGRHQYGINYLEAGYSNNTVRTWRLENRISGNSNMVYLIVDGEELGPMNEYYINKKGINELQEGKADWFNGIDFEINYINNKNFRYDAEKPVDYLQIWENGESSTPHSFYYTETVAPTCTGKGYTSHICSQCGDTWNDNFVDALGHKFGAYTSKDDTMHVRVCSVCGEEQAEAHTWGTPNVGGMQAAYQCTVCDHVKVEVLDKAGIQGKWETDLVMYAADLGVSAPDSVLRCTFDFQKDGTVSNSWKAVDLTALRLYFRDMFVSAYYAMAYGSGITDMEQIEQYCMDSTGMSVSAYMDSIVTAEAMEAAFTPASDTGSYMVNEYATAVYLDLNIMDVSSDSNVPNNYTIQGDTMNLNAASFGKPEYNFNCKRAN